MKIRSLKCLIPVILTTVCLFSTALAGIEDYSAVPPFVVSSAPPNVLLDLSIETPMQGAAYNDQKNDGNGDGDYSDTCDCAGRAWESSKSVGYCYSSDQEYLGIFDPNKAYSYSSGRFVPQGPTNADHSTSGKWSGNLLNWATMTAIDEFRWAMTGGNRETDTTSETVLQRANMTLSAGHSWYPVKKINAGINVAPSTVTPYSDTTIYIYSHNYQIDVGTSVAGNEKADDLNVSVLVCDPSKGLEDNCVEYDGYYKPEGLIQDNDSEMRFAVMAYLYDNSQSRDGGVLRSNMKYVGPFLPDGSVNSAEEYGTDGIFITNPESASEGNSGVINYINKFGSNGYKSYDPAGELFYECLNYFKNRGPTSEYSSGLTTAMKDGFPVITSWDDPIQYECQRNYIVGINDANPWLDKQLPGTYFKTKTFNGVSLIGNDYGEPSNADTDYSVTTWTNTVGSLEGVKNTSQKVGCTDSSCDMSNTFKNIPDLGEVMGTSPGPGKQNSYYIAGMAYYANTQDIRSDIDGTQTINTFMIDTQEYNSDPLTGQMNMLWLAGKYGGFTETEEKGAVHNDTNSDGNALEPDLTSEWDEDSDGVPDNYVLATDPEKLVAGLNKVFNAIAGGANSGTAASVISNTRSGEGAVYQSIFYPTLDDEACNNSVTREVSWVGEVHALLVDENGNMREDSNNDGQLEVADDKFIIYDGGDVFRYTDLDADSIFDAGENVLSNEEQISISEINYLWTSSSWLNADALSPTSQRAYDSVANERYIFTFVDDGDMVAESGEQLDFTDSNIATISPYLHVFDPFEYSASSPPPGITSGDFTAFVGYQAERLVNYIRGEDQGSYSFSSSIIPAMRSRQIDWDDDGSAETWRLGNIVYSTPTQVGVPSEDYDLLYKDTSYQAFYAQYKNRRNVVYVGANDGMLHAFNAGFYNKTDNKFELESVAGGETQYPLGAELWAYVPFNLLPHLYWLTKPTYKDHPVYYVDLKPRIFDAKIFTAGTTHPGGWGTVMVCGMRFGGGVISTDKDHDGTKEAEDQLMHSAYIIMDITNPEDPPVVLAEVTFDDLGFTTSYPAVIFMDPKTSTTNDWYLVLGSGPIDSTGASKTAMEDATSSQNAKIYIIDLNEVGAGTTPLKDAKGNDLPGAGAFAALDATSFISDIIAVDFELNYKTNAVYFGTISGSTGSWEGNLRRIVLKDDIDPGNWIGDSILANVKKPISAAPTVAKDTDGRFWVYFGTGRFLNRTDALDTNTQTFYGVKEPWTDDNSDGYPDISELDWATVDIANDLLDVSNASVFESDQRVTGVSGVSYFDALITEVEKDDGWYLDFPWSGERNLGQGTLLGDLVTFTTYTPTTDVCDFSGSSLLYLLYYKTGTAYYKSVAGTNSDEVIKTIDLGDGMTTTPNIFSSSGSNETKAFVQSSTGAIITIDEANPGTTSSGRISWKEEE